VRAALDNQRAGLVDNWLRHVQDVRDTHEAFLAGLPHELRLDALVELNVLEQARNVCRTTIVRDAWQRGQSVAVHGWVYGLHDGLLRDMAITASAPEDVADAYDVALASLRQRWRQAVRQRASRTTSTEASGSTSPISSTVSSSAPSSL
jgi:carbonic anhydrase